jgi:uncharacterized protein (TIGR02302 family)
MTPPTNAQDDSFATRLGRTRAAVAAAMVVERGWQLVLPLLLVGALFLSAAWLGLFRMLPDMARLALAGLFAAGAIGALYPLRFFTRPTRGEIDRRIERANALVHTPIQALSDKPSGREDPFAAALWREHQRRLATGLGRVGADLPRTRVPERDPWGLRAGVALLFVTAFAFSFGPLGGRLTDAFRAHGFAETVPPRIDAWVTPPAYTGKPPVFLTLEASAATPVFTVPENSELSLRVTGGSGEETLTFTDASGNRRDIAVNGAVEGEARDKPQAAARQAPAAVAPAANGVRQFAARLTGDGTLSLGDGGDALREWAFAVTPDNPPAIRFTGEPRRGANGALELTYEIEDDYGATAANAEFKLAEPQAPDARPLYGAPEMKLSLPRRNARTNGAPAAKTTRDLTEHVWAGAPVTVALKAVDAAGQEARTEKKTFILPEKTFTNPLARAVLEHRRILALDANRKPDVLALIDAITLRPEDTFSNPSHYLGIMAGRTRLVMADTDDELRAVADYYWQMALAIEEGGLSDAERRLKQAQEELKQALENGASDEEIQRLMQELRQAMNEFLREFAQRAERDQNMAQVPPNAQELRRSDLDRMLDQIENMARSGNRQQAQDMLSQLQEMMNNLQTARRQPGQNGQNSEMRQQMDKLGEIMRRQQEMMNETFRMDQMQLGQQGEQGQQGQRGQQGQQGGQGQLMTPEEFAEAMRQLQEGQGQLGRDLEALRKGLQGMGIQPGEGFGEAGEAMGQAENSLGQREGDRAVGQQGRALEALRRGAQDMMQQMMQAEQGEDGQGERGGRQRNAERDPLGRPRATTGPDFNYDDVVPNEIDVQRARQILDAIRKRLGNALSPELERDYLERLLDLR